MVGDDFIFNHGKSHRGKPISEVPDSYLLWVYDNKIFHWDEQLWEYLEDNIDSIRKNATGHQPNHHRHFLE